MNIVKGKIRSAVRMALYGPEGVGKSTFATWLPNPLFIDVEEGTKELDCDRVMVEDWREAEATMKELGRNAQGYQSVVIDTADWLERLIIEHLCRMKGVDSVEDLGGGFGKGYVFVADNFARFIKLCDVLVANGVNVCFLAHSKVQKVSPPDQIDGYDRYELKLGKHTAPLLKEWTELLLFATFRTQLLKGKDSKMKAQGGTERILYAERCAAWDAKNRFGLPPEMPMEFDQIAHLFVNTGTVRQPAPAPVKQEPAPTVPPPDEKQEPMVSVEQMDKIEELVNDLGGAANAAIDECLKVANAVGIDELTAAQAQDLIDVLSNLMEQKKLAPTEPEPAPAETATGLHVPAHIKAWLEENEKKVNAFLAQPDVAYIQPGQTWRDMSQESMDSICERASHFARAAKIPAPTAK